MLVRYEGYEIREKLFAQTVETHALCRVLQALSRHNACSVSAIEIRESHQGSGRAFLILVVNAGANGKNFRMGTESCL